MQGENIIAFSKEWDNDWTSNHHVLTYLAKNNKVLWINSIGTRSPGLSSGKDWKRIIKKVFSFLKGTKKINSNLFVLTPLVWPFQRLAFLQKLSFYLLTLQIRLVAKRLKMKDFQLWTFLPTAESFIGKFREKISVYYCTDHWQSLAFTSEAEIAQEEKKLLEKVDIVFAVSKFLYEEKKKFNSNTYLSSHGVNEIFFQSKEKLKKPEDLGKIPGPILGFYGWLRDTIDQDLVYELSQEYPQASIVLIGKVSGDFSKLKNRSNIYFLGQKPYAELPSYAAYFDLGIIPYQMSKELMIATNPVKFREMLALGIPVVVTDMDEVKAYKDVCWVAENREEFSKSIFEALGPEGKKRVELASSLAAKETWQERVMQISKTLDRFLMSRQRINQENKEICLTSKM